MEPRERQDAAQPDLASCRETSWVSLAMWLILFVGHYSPDMTDSNASVISLNLHSHPAKQMKKQKLRDAV